MTVPIQYPTVAIDSIAVAISGSASQRHLGLLYHLKESEPRHLHLAFHFRLKNDPLPPSIAAVDCPGLDPDEKADFARWINTVWRANGNRIPYGINFWKGVRFDPAGNFNPVDDGIGLTCATFVLSVFQNHGFNILDVSSWLARPEDTAFFEAIMTALTNDGADTSYIAAQRNDMREAIRIRPEEVAASAYLYADEPIGFPQASANGAEMIINLVTQGAL